MKIFLTLILFAMTLPVEMSAQVQDSSAYEKLDKEFSAFMYRYLYRIDINDLTSGKYTSDNEMLEQNADEIFSIGITEARERIEYLFTHLKDLGNKYLSEIDSANSPLDYEYTLEIIQDYYIHLVDLKRNFAEGEFLFRKRLFEKFGDNYEDSFEVKLLSEMPEMFDSLYQNEINLFIDKEIFREFAFPRFGATKPTDDVKPGTNQSLQPQSEDGGISSLQKNENIVKTTDAVQKLKDAEALKKTYEKELRDTFKGQSVVLDFLKK